MNCSSEVNSYNNITALLLNQTNLEVALSSFNLSTDVELQIDHEYPYECMQSFNNNDTNPPSINVSNTSLAVYTTADITSELMTPPSTSSTMHTPVIMTESSTNSTAMTYSGCCSTSSSTVSTFTSQPGFMNSSSSSISQTHVINTSNILVSSTTSISPSPSTSPLSMDTSPGTFTFNSTVSPSSSNTGSMNPYNNNPSVTSYATTVMPSPYPGS